MVQFTSTLILATLAAVPALSAPLADGTQHLGREFDESSGLSARSNAISRAAMKTAGNVLDAVGQSKAKEALKPYTNPPPTVDPKLAEAAKKSSGPFNPAFVQGVIGFKKGLKKREFEGFEDAFERRSQGVSRAAMKAAGNVLDAVGQNKAKETLKQYTNPPPTVDPRLAAAGKKASGPFNPALVQSVIGFKKGLKKREFDDFEDSFERRSQGVSRAAMKAAGNVFDAVGQNKAKETLKQYTNPPPTVDPKLAAAAKKASGPFNPAFVQGVVGFKKGLKKRNLEDMYMYERDFEDFEDVFERDYDYFDGLVERELDELEEREYYGLLEDLD